MKLKKYFFALTLILLLSFLKVENVSANTKFKICTNLTEASYLRSTPGGTELKDVDGERVLLRNPSTMEVLDTVNQGGVQYYKIYANYYSNNYTGYIKSNWVTGCKEYTTDDNYGNELRKNGFPESYILPLQKIHAMHPNWNFTVSNTNIDWNEAVSNESSPADKNLINFTNSLDKVDKSLLSTDGAAYNNGVYRQFQPGWYSPSKQTIAFYMDPRNWLNEKTIFMFEQLSFNQNYHTSNNVQSMLNGTFMQGSYQYNGKNWSYADTFVDVGRQKNVSAIHLASRVLQEQGSTGSATINMNGGDGQTYYNHFNILASGSTVEQIVANALTVAKARGWNNPYLSILGGASTISGEYTSVGQDTNYYEKFNTINHKNLYWHQYMQNVRALPSEARTTYATYLGKGLIDNAYTFKIPVYNNMPDKTSLSIENNSDNTLSSLSVSGCNLNPSFNSSATNYTCNVSNSTNQVTVSATKTSSYSSLKGDGVIVLNGASTEINVIVTAANGNERVYKITVNKVEAGKESPADIISNLGYNNSNNVISGLEIGTDISNIISNIRNKYNLVTIEVKNKNGVSKSSGTIASGDVITIKSGGQTGTFTMMVKGDTNGDGKISISDLAMIKAKLLGNNNLNGVYLSAADINKDGKISISDLAMVKAHLLGTLKITK